MYLDKVYRIYRLRVITRYITIFKSLTRGVERVMSNDLMCQHIGTLNYELKAKMMDSLKLFVRT